MIRYLTGKILFKRRDFAVLDVNGVGYKVFLSQKTLESLPQEGSLANLFCFTNIKENAVELYGFLTEEELDFFEMLMGIRGVGPRAALSIASLGPVKDVKEKIVAQDEKIFEKIPGIGRKKAMAIILEISGKIKKSGISIDSEKDFDEAEEALVNLGFPRKEVKKALSQISENVKDTAERVKQALRILSAK